MDPIRCTTADSQPALEVRRLQDSERERVQELVRGWQELLRAMGSEREPADDRTRRFRYMGVHSGMATAIANKALTVDLCVSGTGECERIHAIAVSKLVDERVAAVTLNKRRPDHLYIDLEWLAAHPLSLDIPGNSERDSQVRGAGTALVEHLKQRCRALRGDGMILGSIIDARPFYQRRGFAEESDWWRRQCGINMHWSLGSEHESRQPAAMKSS